MLFMGVKIQQIVRQIWIKRLQQPLRYEEQFAPLSLDDNAPKKAIVLELSA